MGPLPLDPAAARQARAGEAVCFSAVFPHVGTSPWSKGGPLLSGGGVPEHSLRYHSNPLLQPFQ